jgi:Fe-S-cluster-containing dehydrogenase component
MSTTQLGFSFDVSRCSGCHAYATVCAFCATQFPEGTRMSKCDFCLARVENSLEPACVRMAEYHGERSGMAFFARPTQ